MGLGLSPWRRGVRLRPGDRVAVIAPSGPVPADRLERGVSRLGGRYEIVQSEGLLARQGFLAGEDGRRLSELRWAMSDPHVRAIVCARGGYGVMRLLPALMQMAEATAGQDVSTAPLVGFSDITVLHALYALRQQVTIHGPVVTQLGELSGADAESLWAALEDPAPAPAIEGLEPRGGVSGRLRGRLLGGNLEMLSRLSGTPLSAALAPGGPVVLLIEEVGEVPYRIDRALTQLWLSGMLRSVVALVVGDLVRCGGPSNSGDGLPDAMGVIAERSAAFGIPAFFGAPIGHGDRHRAVALGTAVEIDAGRGTLQFLEGAVQEERGRTVIGEKG